MVSGRVAIIASGGLRAIGSPETVVTAPILSAIYRTEVLVEQTPSGRRVCLPVWEAAAPGAGGLA
jgi:ABC-type cobalamin/Fe3+-siderophores transport system ATPase subunit